MITNCPVCGKGFDVLWPHLWRYKKERTYFCSWTCYRAADRRRKGEVTMANIKKRSRMNADDMAMAIRMFQDGDSGLDDFLTAHGVTNVLKWKQNAKLRHGKKRPTAGDAMQGMKDAADEFFGKCKDMGLKLDKEPEESEFECSVIRSKKTGARYEIFDGSLCVKIGSDEFVLSLDGWRALMKEIPQAAQKLGVEL